MKKSTPKRKETQTNPPLLYTFSHLFCHCFSRPDFRIIQYLWENFIDATLFMGFRRELKQWERSKGMKFRDKKLDYLMLMHHANNSWSLSNWNSAGGGWDRFSFSRDCPFVERWLKIRFCGYFRIIFWEDNLEITEFSFDIILKKRIQVDNQSDECTLLIFPTKCCYQFYSKFFFLINRSKLIRPHLLGVIYHLLAIWMERSLPFIFTRIY